MTALIEDFKQSIADGLQDRTLTSCSRWAARRRVMGGDFGGQYSWKHHPWVREMHDSLASKNWAMKGAQLGVTEVAINRALYAIDKLRRNVLYVLPTSTTASDFSKARFGGALALSPYLRNIFSDINSVGIKQAGSNTLYIRGSRGESNLISIDVSELILDEVDRMDRKAVAMAVERLSGQLRKVIWGISTPTVPNKGIHLYYQGSTQEHFVFECPACSRWTELVWPDCVQIVGENAFDPRCRESYLRCKECKAKLEQAAKPEFLKKACWQSFNANGNPDERGFQISQLYSFTITAEELVREYFLGFGDEFKAKEFRNSKLGLPFVGDGAQVSDAMLDNAVRDYSMQDERPKYAGERIITMGIDQGKWCYATVCEWQPRGPGKDPNVSHDCKVLWVGKFMDHEWFRLDELMREWQVLACVIDADPETNDARRFAKKYDGYVWLCRYRRGKVAREIAIGEEDGGAPVATVDRTNWLTATLGRFKTEPPRIVLPRDIPNEFREHCKNLVRTYEVDEMKNPVAVFVDTGDDHYAHALNYAEIALPLAPAMQSAGNVHRF